MEDYLVRVITKDASVRGLACVTTNLVREAYSRHGTYPTATAALGRALTGGTLMGALLKTGQRVALKFSGNGPIQKVLVEAESNGAVRGYVGVPNVDLPLKDGKIDVGSAVGHAGVLTVTKDLRLKEPYTGIVELFTGEIGDDIAFYLTESEQIPSAVGLGVYVEPDGIVSAAGGFLIQSLPPSDEEIIDKLITQIEAMPSITELLRSGKRP
jgi:molecular chaperone Hsp33